MMYRIVIVMKNGMMFDSESVDEEKALEHALCVVDEEVRRATWTRLADGETLVTRPDSVSYTLITPVEKAA